MAKTGVLTVKVVGDADNFNRTMGGLGQKAKVAFAAVGASAVVGAAKSLEAFVGFERSMNEVFTLLPGISQDAMADMSGQVKSFSKDFGVLPDEVVPALYQSLSAGVPQDNVFEFLETAQMAAKGGVTDLTTAVDGISSVVNAYGADVLNATEASDLMFTAVRLGKTNFEELSASLSNVTPIASGLGVSFEDVSAGLAALTAKGTPTAKATTQMRQLFTELSKEGGKTAKVFEDMAGQTFQEFIAGGGDTADALVVMQNAADIAGVQIQDMFSSVEAGSAAMSLAADDTFTRNIAEMGDSAGATKDAFDQMMTGLGPIIDKVKAWVAVFLIDVGQKLAPVVEAAMQRIGEAFAIVSDWWDQNGPAIMEAVDRVRAAIVGWIDEVRPAIKSWVKNVLGSIRKWWDKNGPKIIALIEGLRDGLTEAIEIMVEAVQFVVEEWDKFKIAIGVAVAIMIPHFVALGVAATASAVKQVAAWVASKAGAISAAVVHSAQVAIMVAGWVLLGVQSLIAAAKVAAAWLIAMGPIAVVAAAVVALVALVIVHWDTIRDTIVGAAKAVLSFLSDNWPLILAIITGPIGVAVLMIVRHWDTIWAATQTVWGAITGFLSTVWDGVVSAWHTVWNGLASFFGSIWDGITAGVQAAMGVIEGVINGIIGAIESAINAVISAINAIPDVKIPSWVPGVGGNEFGIPDVDQVSFGRVGGGGATNRWSRGGWIPTLHAGGMVTASMPRTAGLRPDERLAKLQVGERVIPVSGAPSPTEVHVSVDGVTDLHALAQLLAGDIAWELS